MHGFGVAVVGRSDQRLEEHIVMGQPELEQRQLLDDRLTAELVGGTERGLAPVSRNASNARL